MPLQQFEPTESDDQTTRPHSAGGSAADPAEGSDGGGTGAGDGGAGGDSGDGGAGTERPDTGSALTLVPPALEHGRQLWRLAGDAGLDVNSPYAYALWCRDFAASSVAALDPGGTVRGFVIGYIRPDDPDCYFLWQVAVDPAMRGQGLAGRMLRCIGDRVAGNGVHRLEATVTPGNAASRALFASFARERGTEPVWTPLFERSHFPDGAAHDPEELVRIGLA
ncbi:diaminobutyrate acetyltransferase [Murinocardiopsis flavida]|uniref:diaminobutyrate acetyltransferase n=1 Tax=Murinocardiopsis flavida TaxID=645275 RepID=UPI0031835DA8